MIHVSPSPRTSSQVSRSTLRAPGLANGSLITFRIKGLHNAAQLLVGLLGIAAFPLNWIIEHALS